MHIVYIELLTKTNVVAKSLSYSILLRSSGTVYNFRRKKRWNKTFTILIIAFFHRVTTGSQCVFFNTKKTPTHKYISLSKDLSAYMYINYLSED